MLNHRAATAARPKAHAYRLTDERGLYLDVRPNGSKRWRMRFRDAQGKEQLLTFGLFPAETIDAARARRDAARAAIAAGADPRTHNSHIRICDFEAAARAWHAHRAPGWSPVHAADVLRSLERDVFPAIGASALDGLTRPTVLVLLRAIEARDAIATARRVRQRIEMVCAFARAEGWMTVANPGDVGEGLANTPAEGRQAALVDVAPVVKLASRFLALTAVRLAALRGLTWDEVEDLDGAAPTWRVPAARMKLAAKHKADAARDHLVPLSAEAVSVLREARDLGGAGELVFPGRGGTAAIGAGAIGELYARAGFAGRHVPHGWRASFSTVMNERRPADRADIDRALGHTPKGMTKVERAYNRAQLLDLRRSILTEWGALIAPATSMSVRMPEGEPRSSPTSPSPSTSAGQ